MTRSNGDRVRPPARPRPVRDPYGLLPAGTPIAAILAVVGLLVITLFTVSLSGGQLPFVVSGGGGGPDSSDGPGVVTRTPTPSNIVVIPDDPLADVPGTIVYVKDGNVWLQSGHTVRQLTSGGNDSMPSFSPDGESVYFVRSREAQGYWSVDGVGKQYRLDVPSIMQVPVAGGDPTRILDGLVDPAGRPKWQGWIREPVVSPDGKTIAMATDLPDPTTSDVVLKLLTLKTGKLTNPGLSQQAPLGHQNPAWRPDGARLLYVRNDRDGAKGSPRIYSYNPATKKSSAVTAAGYLHPSWSPDGRYIAATKTSAFGTDVVILNAANGAELLRVTDDGSRRPWSPRRPDRGCTWRAVVDLRMAELEDRPPPGRSGSPDLTTSAGLTASRARLVHPGC
jgi:Tol biopolymer transport system component